MKHFFALATAVALAISPLAIAYSIPDGEPVSFGWGFNAELLLGVEPHDMYSPPPPGTRLFLDADAFRVPMAARPPDYSINTFVLSAPMDGDFRQINYLSPGPTGTCSKLCITARGIDSTPPTLEACAENDPGQLWQVYSGWMWTTLRNKNDRCVNVTKIEWGFDPKLVNLKLSMTSCGGPTEFPEQDQVWRVGAVVSQRGAQC